MMKVPIFHDDYYKNHVTKKIWKHLKLIYEKSNENIILLGKSVENILFIHKLKHATLVIIL